MKITRKASANWKGAGKTGKGTLTTNSGVLSDTKYSFSTRFEDEPGTNPEELIGAAHSGCFSMKLAFVLQENGTEAEDISTESKVELEDGAIKHVYLKTKVKAPGLDKDKFTELVNDAKDNCPISKLLNAEIHLEAELV
ncbi:OsmC family protein [Marinigracilibium pacificum]|uniref:OsmC family protein n=1 Tax=Marinigracilibium pacificum TaxID=2729599 RepID=A0A848J2U3_9BACT|nr:OsmC family protein [Marinigracilibium pacificum]NMM48860.1 OsmC family protein [Marinigracilibium pacificum]